MTHPPLAQKSNVEYVELLEKLQDIPTLPVVAMKVNELLNDPTSSGSDIAEVLKQDQVLTAKILRLVNSSYYAIPGGVSDVQRALAFLGFNTVAQLVLGISVMSLFDEISEDEFTMLDFWKHALATAVCSEILAKRLDYPRPEEAFTCGLLHDIGKLVMHEIDPERLRSILSTSRMRECSFVEVEKEREVPGHTYLGEVIAGHWGLPQVIRLAIRYHHMDVSRMGSILDSEKPAIQIVRLANTVVVKNEIGKSGDDSKGTVSPDMLVPLGLTRSDLKQVEDQLEEAMARAGGLLDAYK